VDSPGQLDQIRCEIRGTTALITLTNPRRRNAINLEMVHELVSTLDSIEASGDVHAVVVTGEGPAFCAGAELSHLMKASEESEAAEEALRSIYRGFMRLQECSLPTIAAVNGPAVGAGMNMALVCDIRIAARSAVFATRFMTLGLHPGGGHTWMLRRAVGPQAALAAVLLDDDMDGETAARRGLAWSCVADDELVDEALRMAAKAGGAPLQLLRDTKRSIQDMADVRDYAAAVDYELPKQMWSAQHGEFVERMERMAAARPARP
jgi:enoyl-CoA hydratase